MNCVTCPRRPACVGPCQQPHLSAADYDAQFYATYPQLMPAAKRQPPPRQAVTAARATPATKQPKKP